MAPGHHDVGVQHELHLARRTVLIARGTSADLRDQQLSPHAAARDEALARSAIALDAGRNVNPLRWRFLF
jgi:hypothetical protein